MIKAQQLVDLQAKLTDEWHQQPIGNGQEDLLALVTENHRNNFELWHEEDKARRDDMGADYVYQAKRKIDGFNQTRNDYMEKMDQWFSERLQPKQDGSCPYNSETPGMMIDRLSILALKAYHMQEQVDRDDVDAGHREACQKKVATIMLQRDVLAQCLDELIAAVQADQRSFKVYFQFKMYNDPSLNPQLYKAKSE